LQRTARAWQKTTPHQSQTPQRAEPSRGPPKKSGERGAPSNCLFGNGSTADRARLRHGCKRLKL
jgi:hypothetical protein